MTLRTILDSEIKRGFTVTPLNAENAELYRAISGGGVNYYSIATNFYRNGLWGQHPDTEADVELLESLEYASIMRSVNGTGVVICSQGSYQSVDTRYHWGMRNPATGLTVGHVVMFPYATSEQAFPDRIRVVSWVAGTPTLEVSTWTYEGASLGMLQSSENVEGQLVAIGDGVDDYTNMKWLVTELNNRMRRNSALLDRHSSPHIQGPSSALSSHDDGSPRFNINQDAAFLPKGEDTSQNYEYLTWDPNAALAQYQVDTLRDLLHLETGVPSAAYGLAATNAPSGISLDRQMFAALSKIRRLRREIERALRSVSVSDLIWPQDPFASYNENVASEIALVGAGITSAQEAADRLGVSPPATSNEAIGFRLAVPERG